MENVDDECFYVCLNIEEAAEGEDLRLVSIVTSSKLDLFDDLEKSQAAASATSFENIFDEFVEVMLGYIDMLPVFAAVPSGMVGLMRLPGLVTVLEHIGTEIDAPAGQRRFRIPDDKFSRWESFQAGRRTANLVAKQLPKMLLIGVVSALEHYEALAIAECLRLKPEKYLSKDRSVALSDIIDIGSIDELKRTMLDRDVDSIMRESTADQMRRIEGIIDLKESISGGYEKWNELLELLERRNLFAHSNGVVNEIYVRNTSRLNLKTKHELGEELFVTSDYFSKSINNVFEFGVNLIQVMWRKTAPGEQGLADDELGLVGYSLLERGKYRLSVRLLRIAVAMRGKKDEYRRRMDIVNLANAYRLLGDEGEAKRTLDTEDWSIVDDAFKISVAAVRGDVDRVVELILKWSPHEEMVGASGFESWPVFYGMRDGDKFKDAFASRFGRQFQPVPMIRNSTIDAINEIQSISKKRDGSSGSEPDSSVTQLPEEPDEESVIH